MGVGSATAGSPNLIGPSRPAGIDNPEDLARLQLGDEERAQFGAHHYVPMDGKSAASPDEINDIRQAVHLDASVQPGSKQWKDAVIQFQKDNHLRADGAVGQQTWAALGQALGKSVLKGPNGQPRDPASIPPGHRLLSPQTQPLPPKPAVEPRRVPLSTPEEKARDQQNLARTAMPDKLYPAGSPELSQLRAARSVADKDPALLSSAQRQTLNKAADDLEKAAAKSPTDFAKQLGVNVPPDALEALAHRTAESWRAQARSQDPAAAKPLSFKAQLDGMVSIPKDFKDKDAKELGGLLFKAITQGQAPKDFPPELKGKLTSQNLDKVSAELDRLSGMSDAELDPLARSQGMGSAQNMRQVLGQMKGRVEDLKKSGPSAPVADPHLQADLWANPDVNAKMLSKSVLFTGASPADQQAMVQLAKAGQAGNLLALGDKLYSRDTQGTRLLDNAVKLATEPMPPELSENRKALLTDTLAEAADPSLINQRNRGTCSVTSCELMLADNAAERTRLVAGLASQEGTVAMANGDKLTRLAGTERRDDSGRTDPQRLLQSALMSYATHGKYQNTSTAHGLMADEIAHVASALTGRRVVAQTGTPCPVTGAEDARRNVTGLMGTPWKGAGAATPLKDPLWQSVANAHGQTLAGLRWRDGGHAILIDHVANGRVYFQNPQGNQVAAGKDYPPSDPPPRRSEGKNLQSMTVDDFRTRLFAVEG